MKKLLTISLLAITMLPVLKPHTAAAAEAPDIVAPAYAARDVATGKIVFSKNANTKYPAASLTKIVTALVVLDTNPDLKKQVAITKSDQTMGACGRGGGCIKTKPGVKYTIDALFHAALLPSANNAAAALARSTGLSTKQFAARMNAKVKALGAANSKFYEPTGMNKNNLLTAADYSKIMAAAFANPYLRDIEQKGSYDLVSTNDARYNQTVKNSNKLLAQDDLTIIGAKTGYLTRYNFAAVLKYNGGRELSIVVLNEKHMYSAFGDTRNLAIRTQEELSQIALK